MSAESNTMPPTRVRLPTSRIQQGDAPPRMAPGPSIESTLAKITMSSTTSSIAGELSKQSPGAATTRSEGRSPMTMEVQRAAAAVNAAVWVGVIAVRKRRSML